MNKIKYMIKIGNFTSEFEISKPYQDDKMIRYAKTALKKRGIDYSTIIKNELKLSISECPFCGNDSKYDVIYKIDHTERIVMISGIQYSMAGGMQNYHCKGGRKNCIGSLLNPNSIEYISKSFKISESEANTYLITRNKSPFYKQNHETPDDYKKYQSKNLDWYLEKYGTDEGNRRFVDFKNKVSKGNSKNILIEKYGIDSYNEMIKKKSVCNISFFIEKYGEIDGKEKFEAYKKSLGRTKDQYIEKFGVDSWNNRRKNIEYRKSLEYFIQLLGYHEGLIAFNNLRKSFSFNSEKYILKYGEKAWIDRWSNINKKFYSKEASVFFEMLLSELGEIGIILKNIKMNEDEFFLWDSEYRRIYFYDLYFEYASKKIIIEYDNNFWHPVDDTCSNAWNNMKFNHRFTKKEKLEYDERKKMLAKYKGYEIITLSYKGKNPLRNKNLWNNLLNESLKEIKQILEC